MFNNLAMKFGERLELALIHMEWGPKDLEVKTGVADSTISAIIRRASDRSNFSDKLINGFPADRINHEWLRSEVGKMTPDLAGQLPKFTTVASAPVPEHSGSKYSTDAEIIARMIDLVPESEVKARALVFNAASTAIFNAVQQWRSRGQGLLDSGK